MNIDFLAIGGTAWTVAGTMIIACQSLALKRDMQLMVKNRWCN